MNIVTKLKNAPVQTLAGNGQCCIRDGQVGISSLASPFRLSLIPQTENELLVADNHPFGLRLVDQRCIQTLQYRYKPRLHIDVGDFAFDPRDKNIVFLTDPLHNKIKKLNIRTGELIQFSGALSGHADDFISQALYVKPKGIAFACSGMLLLVGQADGTLRAIDIDKGIVSTILKGKKGKRSQVEGIHKLTDAAIWDVSKIIVSKVYKGVIYIVDSKQHCVHQLNTVEQSSRIIMGYPGRAGRGVVEGYTLLNRPSGGCELPGGEILVCDSGNNVLKVVEPIHLKVETLNAKGKGWVDGALRQAQFCEPSDVCISLPVQAGFELAAQTSGRRDRFLTPGHLFVCDRGNNAVRVITLQPDLAEAQLGRLGDLKRSRVIEQVLQATGPGRRFKVYCRRCQGECDLGMAHTCSRCGSTDVVVHDTAPKDQRQALVSSVFYAADTDQTLSQKPIQKRQPESTLLGLEMGQEHETDDPDQVTMDDIFVQSPQHARQPAAQKSETESAGLFLTSDPEHAHNQHRAKVQGMFNDIAVNQGNQIPISTNKFELSQNTYAYNPNIKVMNPQDDENIYGQHTNLPSAEEELQQQNVNSQTANFAKTVTTEWVARDEEKGQATLNMFEGRMPQNYIIDKNIFEKVASAFGVNEIIDAMQDCPKSDPFTDVISNKNKNFDSLQQYQKYIENTFQPLVYIKAQEGDQFFKVLLPVNKLGYQFTKFVDSENTIVQIQINSHPRSLEIYAVDPEGKRYMNKFRECKCFIESYMDNARCYECVMSDLLAFGQIVHNGIYAVEINIEFDDAIRRRYMVHFGHTNCQGANLWDFDNIQIVRDENQAVGNN